MSNYERWIIYQLLFFAFALAAKDQFEIFQPISSNDFVSHKLIANQIGARTIDVATVRTNGVDVMADDGTIVARIRANEFGGVIEAFDMNQNPIIELIGSQEGGRMLTHQPSLKSEEPGTNNEEQDTTAEDE